jgi:2,5-furandicarboxylate decarboxylase 1
MSKDLRQFLQLAKKAGPHFYVEVKKPLKPELEVGIIQHKLASEGRYPAIYCPEIEGSRLPLVTNLLGSYEMFALALDMDPKVEKPKILQEYMKRVNNVKPPQMVPASEAPVKEVVLRGSDVNLGLLPILKHAELNSGKYMTINPLICRDPVTGIPNVGDYRHEVKGKDELGAFISPANHGAIIARKHAELGKTMEVVIFSGHHPAVMLGACQPGALDMNELEVMGGLLEEPLRVTSAETVSLPVPADAEIVVEGVIDPNEWITDGPFSEFLGYYGEEMPCYRIKVRAITMRKDAIYFDLDPAHREHPMGMILPNEAAVYNAVKKVVADLRAVHCPPSGSCSHHVYISMKQGVHGEAKRAALAALAAVHYFKLAVVVDEDIDIYNDEEVLWAISTRMRGDLDIDMIPGVVGNRLDPAGAYDELRHKKKNALMTTKVIIDATKPVDLPFPTRITPNKKLWETMNLKDYLK